MGIILPLLAKGPRRQIAKERPTSGTISCVGSGIGSEELAIVILSSQTARGLTGLAVSVELRKHGEPHGKRHRGNFKSHDLLAKVLLIKRGWLQLAGCCSAGVGRVAMRSRPDTAGIMMVLH